MGGLFVENVFLCEKGDDMERTGGIFAFMRFYFNNRANQKNEDEFYSSMFKRFANYLHSTFTA